MPLTDAHCHLQVPELAPHLQECWTKLPALGISKFVVNGTSETDWPAVAALARSKSSVMPCFGLHPWFIKTRSSQWLQILESFLDAHPQAGVGEIGLDRWVADHDFDDQLDVFRAQIATASARNLPTTIHCIQAWGALQQELSTLALPARGLLIHAYGGSSEMVPDFVSKGCYFSFSPSFLHPRKLAQREVFAKIPLDRLLIETDAPALGPPPELNLHPLTHPETQHPTNHPMNLLVALNGLAQIRQLPPATLADILESNTQQWLSRNPRIS